MSIKAALVAVAFTVLSLVAAQARAQDYSIIHQSLDANRHGYTVLRVAGTDRQMGYGIGSALAPDIVALVEDVKASAGSDYATLRSLMNNTLWLPTSFEQEYVGIVEAIAVALPEANIDLVDIKVINAFSDWTFIAGCRAHAAWGRYVTPPVRALLTRRLDYSTVFDAALHHVLYVRDPDDGTPRWISLGAPGLTSVATGLNAYGVAVSIHNYGSAASFSSSVAPRMSIATFLLTQTGGQELASRLDWAQQQLASINVAAGGFINYFAPDGHGGVFTCTSGSTCAALRRPQSDYFFGEVLMTTNSQTDGLSTPGGGDFMSNYYASGGAKDLASHFALMGTSGLQLMSVAYRGDEDMTIWILGRGRSDRLELEWQQLYGSSAADAGTRDLRIDDVRADDHHTADGFADDAAGVDAHPTDALQIENADAGTQDRIQDDANEAGAGCSCANHNTPLGYGCALFGFVFACRRQRRR